MKIYGISIIIFIFILMLSTPAIARKNGALAEFRGHRSNDTELFRMQPGWYIKYRVSEDKHFSAILRDDESRYIDLAINCIGPKKGVYYHKKGGTFYFDIKANCHYKIEIFRK